MAVYNQVEVVVLSATPSYIKVRIINTNNSTSPQAGEGENPELTYSGDSHVRYYYGEYWNSDSYDSYGGLHEGGGRGRMGYDRSFVDRGLQRHINSNWANQIFTLIPRA